jgi:hypothetical protein
MRACHRCHLLLPHLSAVSGHPSSTSTTSPSLNVTQGSPKPAKKVAMGILRCVPASNFSSLTQTNPQTSLPKAGKRRQASRESRRRGRKQVCSSSSTSSPTRNADYRLTHRNRHYPPPFLHHPIVPQICQKSSYQHVNMCACHPISPPPPSFENPPHPLIQHLQRIPQHQHHTAAGQIRKKKNAWECQNGCSSLLP